MDDGEKRDLERARAEAFVNPVAIPYDREFSVAEFDRITQGFKPLAMEDKWAVTYNEPHLDFIRSWTGIGIYRLEFRKTESGVKVVSAIVNKETAKQDGTEYSAALVDFLLRNILLGLAKPFPKPVGIVDDPAGLFQHHISGTGYAERAFQNPENSKPWWRFW
jgi:hypothetical protein